MNSFSDLLTALGPLKTVGDRFGVTAQAISNMKIRNAVNGRYWPFIVALAAEVGIPGVTFDFLVELDRQSRHQPTVSPQAADGNENPTAENLSGKVAA